MKKQKSQPQPSQDRDQWANSIPNFLELQNHVFEAKGKDVYVGGIKVTPQLRSVLRDEAENLKTTRLWEIMNASVLNESYNLALSQSTDWNAVLFAKGLRHWTHFLMNVVHILSKKD